MFKPPYLQKYKGKSSRHTCPACNKLGEFTLYLDGNTHQPIHKTVGICSRAVKCGYHYPPKQYFLDNPHCKGAKHSDSISTKVIKRNTPSPKVMVAGEIPFSYVESSLSYQSNFIHFLRKYLTSEQIDSVCNKYAIGATKRSEVIYWQIDTNYKVRTGKIMQYDRLTGKRIKNKSGAIDWVHNKLKQKGKLRQDFNLQQILFGEHLLSLEPYKPVCIVEAEKTAIISAALYPDSVWLATGGIQNLSVDKCKILKNRTVIFFPDLGGFDKWHLKAIEIQKLCKCTISVSDILENEATPYANAEGLDIADFFIAQLMQSSTHEITLPHDNTIIPTNPINENKIDNPEGAITPYQFPFPVNNDYQSLFNIALELIGERNHLPKQTIISNMIHSYHIDETRAENGFKSLIDNKIIEPTHLNSYVLSHSTPF